MYIQLFSTYTRSSSCFWNTSVHTPSCFFTIHMLIQAHVVAFDMCVLKILPLQLTCYLLIISLLEMGELGRRFPLLYQGIRYDNLINSTAWLLQEVPSSPNKVRVEFITALWWSLPRCLVSRQIGLGAVKTNLSREMTLQKLNELHNRPRLRRA